MKTNINKLLELDDNIKIHITWRLVFYLIYLSITIFLVVNALFGYYEDKAFTGFVFLLFIMSYPFSIFLIRKEV
jgi:hypothetical protein